MENKVWTYINWGVLVVVTVAAVWMILNQTQEADWEGVSVYSSDCVDIEDIDGFEYEACYDAISEMIFLKANRNGGKYKVNSLEVSFVDLSSQFFILDDVPEAGGSKAYKISANKNPQSLSIKLDVVKDFSESICEGMNVFVDYCPVGTSGEGVDVSISPIGGVGIKDFIEVQDLPDFGSDIVAMDLVEKEAIWESVCKSDWDCGKWEACEDGVQRRSCSDLNNCIIPTDPAVSVRNCDGSCIENWECEWSGCEDGFSVPDCKDLNNCGTSLSIPKRLACEEQEECSPDVICEEWTECSVDYDFIDLVGADRLTQLEGGQTRICVDKKGCVATVKENRICSVSVDIYTERFEKCGKTYVGVYDVLDDDTLAVLEEGRGEKNYLNIYFNDQDGVYCDYCFDGKMNGDEEDVDCGGSCKACEVEVLPKKNWWDFLFDF